MKFVTISELITDLERYKNAYGNLPILLGIKGEGDNAILHCLAKSNIMDIKDHDKEESQRVLVLSNGITGITNLAFYKKD